MAEMFPAQYDGTCAACAAEFDAGDLVGYVDDELCCDGCWNMADEEPDGPAGLLDGSAALLLAAGLGAAPVAAPAPIVVPPAPAVDLPARQLAQARDAELQAPVDPPGLTGDCDECPGTCGGHCRHGKAVPYTSLPLNQSQWQEQAAALQGVPLEGATVDSALVADLLAPEGMPTLEDVMQAAPAIVVPAPPAPRQWVDPSGQLWDYLAGSNMWAYTDASGVEWRMTDEDRQAIDAGPVSAAAGIIVPAPPAAPAGPVDFRAILWEQLAEEQLDERELAQLAATDEALETAAEYAGPFTADQIEDALEHLLDILRAAIDNTPRSLQTRIGPSEIGTPCEHCLAAKLSGWQQRREGAWLPTVGTAVHTWAEGALLEHMRRGLDSGRYLAEHKTVTGILAGQLIPGSTDVLDVVAGMTVDWKVVGATTLKAARGGPSRVYRIQAHTYAKGWRLKGVRVDWVAVMYLPRNAASLSEAVRWFEPYDESLVDEAYARAERVKANLDALEAAGGTDMRDAYITGLPRERDARGKIICHDCKRYPDYPAAEVTLDGTAGGLLEVEA